MNTTTRKSIQFVNCPPVRVVDEETGDVFEAGKLSVAGHASSVAVGQQMRGWLKANHNYTLEKREKGETSYEANVMADFLRSDQAYHMLMCDFSETLRSDPTWLFGLSEEFVGKCYDACVMLNPSLDKERAEELKNLGATQKEAVSSETGELKSKDELAPLG